MKLKPHHVDGKKIAVFSWDHTQQCGGSAIHFGIARFCDDLFYVERHEEPARISIPKNAWMTLLVVEKGDKKFSPAEIMVMLRLDP